VLNRNLEGKTRQISVVLNKNSERYGGEREAICRKGCIIPEAMAERGAPLHRSTVGQTEIGTACLKRSKEERGYLSLKLDAPSFNVTPCAALLDR
jgi:uncharacterized protein (DUF736 family)